MRFFRRYGVHVVAVALIVGGVAGYNVYNEVHAMALSHEDLLNQARERIGEYGVTPVSWSLFEEAKATLGGVRETAALAEKNGQQVMLLGYAEPHDPEGKVKKLNEVTDLTQCIAGCCAKPIKYANVTVMDVAPLPPNCYILQEQPAHAKIRIDLSDSGPVTFIANSPQLFSGTLRLAENEANGVHYVLENPELITLKELMNKGPASLPGALDRAKEINAG